MKQIDRPTLTHRANYVCELCYGPIDVLSVHHRRPRKMGGTKWEGINDNENLLVLCGTGTTGCHGYVESHRQEGYANGWLVRMGFWPALTPFRDRKGQWWLLYEDSKIAITPPEAFDEPLVGSNQPLREESEENVF